MDIKLVSEFLKKPFDGLFDLLKEELKYVFKNKLLEYQVEEYKRNFYTKTILHRIEPVPLDSIYQPLYIQQEKPQTRISTDSARQLFIQYPKISIIGFAGSGKSTIIKHLFVKCFEEGYRIPIKIELRHLNDYSGSITNYIFDEIFAFYQLGFTTDIVSRVINSNSFIFFFDGYDEIDKDAKERRTTEIDSFVNRFPNNNYLITTRPYTNIELLPLFTNFSVAELDESEIESFIQKQLINNDYGMAETIIQFIKKTSPLHFNSFLKNPLLLSLFILTFPSISKEEHNYVHNKCDFYRQVFETLYYLHDGVSKLGYVRKKISSLTQEIYNIVLRRLSYISYFEEKFIMSTPYIEDRLSFIKKNTGIDFDNKDFLYDLQVSIGILTKEGIDFSFPHRSLQEYFAASCVQNFDIIPKKKFYLNRTEEILSNPRLALYRENFYDLLGELDENNLLKELGIPILQHLIIHAEQIKKNKEEVNSLNKILKNKSSLSEKKLLETQKESLNEQISVLLTKEFTIASFLLGTIFKRILLKYRRNIFTGFYFGSVLLIEYGLANRTNSNMEEAVFALQENGNDIISLVFQITSDINNKDLDLIGFI